MFEAPDHRSWLPWVTGGAVALGIVAALVPHGATRMRVLLAGGDPRRGPEATSRVDFPYPRDPLEWSLALDPGLTEADRARVLSAADTVAEDVGWWLLWDTGAADVTEAEAILWARDRGPDRLAEACARRVQEDAVYSRAAFGGHYLPDADGNPSYVHPDELTLVLLHVCWKLDLRAVVVPSPVHRYVLLHEPGGTAVRGVEATCFRCVGEQQTKNEPSTGPWLVFPEDFYPSGVGAIRNPTPLPKGTYVPVPPDALEGVLVAGLQDRGRPDAAVLVARLAEHPDDAAVAGLLWRTAMAEAVAAANESRWDALAASAGLLRDLRRNQGGLVPPAPDERALDAALAFHRRDAEAGREALRDILGYRDAERGPVKAGDVLLPQSDAHALALWLSLEHGVATAEEWNVRVVPLLAKVDADPMQLDRLCAYARRLLRDAPTDVDSRAPQCRGHRP